MKTAVKTILSAITVTGLLASQNLPLISSFCEASSSGQTDSVAAHPPDSSSKSNGALDGAGLFLKNHSDLPGHWAAKAISNFAQSGIVSGYPDNSFKPDATITRAEAAVILSHLNIAGKLDGKSFNDVGENDWFYNAVTRGTKLGVIDGYSDGGFLPQKNVTRQEMFKLVELAVEKMTGNLPDTSNIALNFSDKDQIEDWAKPYTKSLVQSGKLKGYPDNTIRPNNDVTRAEFVSLLSDMLSTFKTYEIKGNVTGYVKLANVDVFYVIDGLDRNSVKTDENGDYKISYLIEGTDVTVLPCPQKKFTVSPEKYEISHLNSDTAAKDFLYDPTSYIGGGAAIKLSTGGGTTDPSGTSDAATCQISFYRNWDNNDQTVEDTHTTLVANSKIDEFPQNPERPGYKFVGWSASRDGSTGLVALHSEVKEDLNLYAQWVERGV